MKPFQTLGPRLGFAAKAAAGISGTAAATFYVQTRNCHFETFSPKTDPAFFRHAFFGQINPWNKPLSADSCVREIPLESLDKTLLEQADSGESAALVERFTQGLWGGIGYAIQRRIMEFTINETNKEDVWSRNDLLRCKYEPGTYVTNHFLVLSKNPASIIMRGCFDPHQSPPTPMNVDNLVEITATLDKERKVAVLKLRVATFNGTEGSSDAEDPFGGVGGWLHRRYSTALVESGARNCMR